MLHTDIRKHHKHNVCNTHTHCKPTMQPKVSTSDFRSTSQLVEKAVATWLPAEKQNNKELFSLVFRVQRGHLVSRSTVNKLSSSLAS